jgi:hypothetical protein
MRPDGTGQQLNEKGQRVGRDPAEADYHIEIMDIDGKIAAV